MKRWQTYLSAQGWVILDEDNQPLLNTRSDDTGPEVAEIVRRYNELVAAFSEAIIDQARVAADGSATAEGDT
jgi:hypothetical protein